MASILIVEGDEDVRGAIVARLSVAFPLYAVTGCGTLDEARKFLNFARGASDEKIVVIWASGLLPDGASPELIREAAQMPNVINVGASAHIGNQQRDAGCTILINKNNLAHELPNHIALE